MRSNPNLSKNLILVQWVSFYTGEEDPFSRHQACFCLTPVYMSTSSFLKRKNACKRPGQMMDLILLGDGVGVHASRLHPLFLASCQGVTPLSGLSTLLCFLFPECTEPGSVEDHSCLEPCPVFQYSHHCGDLYSCC